MKKKLFVIISTAVLLVLVFWVLWADSALQLTEITVPSVEIPESFDGFRIAHISDLHSKEFGEGNAKLLNMLRMASPDLIAITGDLMDSRDQDPSVALNFAAEAVKIAPCYYITGNHEVRLSDACYTALLVGLRACGVNVLEDEDILISRASAQISLYGHGWGSADTLKQSPPFEGYSILLSHPPEDIEDYAAAGFDLVLSGHAHGGQFRLPFFGGVFAPGQGFFPDYDSGLYVHHNTQMVVSRGLGNSTFPFRINNRPEIVLIVLSHTEG